MAAEAVVSFGGLPVPPHWQRRSTDKLLKMRYWPHSHLFAMGYTYKMGDGSVVPTNGEINKELAVYKSVCCGAEIVIIAGATLPDRPNHPKLTTIWKSTTDDEPIRHVSQL